MNTKISILTLLLSITVMARENVSHLELCLRSAASAYKQEKAEKDDAYKEILKHERFFNSANKSHASRNLEVNELVADLKSNTPSINKFLMELFINKKVPKVGPGIVLQRGPLTVNETTLNLMGSNIEHIDFSLSQSRSQTVKRSERVIAGEKGITLEIKNCSKISTKMKFSGKTLTSKNQCDAITVFISKNNLEVRVLSKAHQNSLGIEKHRQEIERIIEAQTDINLLEYEMEVEKYAQETCAHFANELERTTRRGIDRIELRKVEFEKNKKHVRELKAVDF